MAKNKGQPFMIENPLIVMFHNGAGGITTRVHPPKEWDHRHYGMLVCDLVRHISRAMKVPEGDIWTWVDKERDRPTSDITTAS